MQDTGRAVVLGAGVAGLLAARVLADHHDRVVIVERDRLPMSPGDRRGVAQGRHIHALAARGQQILESLFPSLTAELVAAGANSGDALECARFHVGPRRLHPTTTGLTLVSASRPLLEHHIRARVLARPDVALLEGCDAVGLAADRSGGRVTGVLLGSRTGGGAEETLPADVVVDATGRSSRTPTWLAALGFPSPREDRVRVDVAYASRRYRMAADSLGGDLAIINAPTPEAPRTGALGLLEAGTAIVTLAGVCGDRPPLDPGGFEDFARSLATQDIGEAIAGAEPVDDPVPHRFPATTWRRYDRLRSVPEGCAVVGDGLCSLNPVYGQGMSVAALEAQALDRHLTRHGRLRARRLHRSMARVVRPAWQMTTGADLQFAAVEGRRPPGQRAVGAYISRLQAAAEHDPVLSGAFIRVAGLVDPPGALLRPHVVARVLRPRPGRNGAPARTPD